MGNPYHFTLPWRGTDHAPRGSVDEKRTPPEVIARELTDDTELAHDGWCPELADGTRCVPGCIRPAKPEWLLCGPHSLALDAPNTKERHRIAAAVRKARS